MSWGGAFTPIPFTLNFPHLKTLRSSSHSNAGVIMTYLLGDLLHSALHRIQTTMGIQYAVRQYIAELHSALHRIQTGGIASFF